MTTPASLLRAAREAATPTAAELAARAHAHGPSPASGISQGELAARYNAAFAKATGVPGRMSRGFVSRLERGDAALSPTVRATLERALRLGVGALAGVEEKSTDQ